MRDFIKTTLAVILGILLSSAVGFFLLIAVAGSVATLTSKPEVGIPSKAVLKIDMQKLLLAEQTKQDDFLSTMQSGVEMSTIGIYDAVSAINAAAEDPAIQYIYLKPDAAAGGIAQLEELRKALADFRSSGKAVIAYMEAPSNAGYYLASVADKVYMTPHRGGMVTMTGLSSQMFYIKDILDKLGINVQLIRHGKYKSAGEMYIRNDISDENREQYESLLNSIWDGWVSQISASRGISEDAFNQAVDDLKLVVPEDFLLNHLADELLTREELENKLCDLYDAQNISQVRQISLADYARTKLVPNIHAKEKIAVIYADGQIMDGSKRQDMIDGDRYASIIRKVRRDSSIKAVVFRVNSPGGTVLSAEKIKAEIDLLKETKPVIASFGAYAASGGYWISNSCDRIYSDAGTLTGSIGVFSMIPDFSRTMKTIAHITPVSVSTNKHGDLLGCMRPLDDDEKAYMQASVEDIYDRFTSIVAQGRGMDVEKVDELAQGRVWAGSDALRIGLVDEIGGIQDALRYAASVADSEATSDLANWQIVSYPKPLSPWEEILVSLGEKSEETVFSGTPLEATAEALSRISTQEPCAYARLPFDVEIK